MDQSANMTAGFEPVKTTKSLEPFPAVNKDNFKIYHENKGPIYPVAKSYMQKNSIYLTTPDVPIEQKIVNEPKPQVTLRYLTIRGKQYSLQSAQKSTNSAKKRRINKS